MKETFCPICDNIAPFRLKKGNTEYHQCSSCKTIFSGPLDNDNLVGGMAEVERNTTQNHIRIARIDEMSYGMKKEDVHILDFGCGHGYLLKDLIVAGYVNTKGYDAFNEEFVTLPEKNKYHIIVAVEVCEHLSRPFFEMDVMYRSLLPGGAVYIETGMLDAAIEDGYDIDTYFYINPEAGHSTIYTNHGLDVLMLKKGFTPAQHFNKHTRLYRKNNK